MVSIVSIAFRGFCQLPRKLRKLACTKGNRSMSLLTPTPEITFAATIDGLALATGATFALLLIMPTTSPRWFNEVPVK